VAALASLADYNARYGEVADDSRILVLLDEASSFVRDVAGLTISLVEDDTTMVRPRRGIAMLPEFPVTALTSITPQPPATPTPVDPTSYEWDDAGIIAGLYGSGIKHAVVYSHGWDPVPEWIVGLVCSMVQRATRPAALNAVASETTGGQTTSYNTSLAGVSLWLTAKEEGRLRSLKGPTIG
jgi:hypothetical protein